MRSCYRGGLFVVLLLSLSGCGDASPDMPAERSAELQEEVPNEVVVLWPAGVPGALGEGEADTPTLTVYLPDPGRATGTAVVICPGGGYQMLAVDHEGRDVARWLNSLGVAAFVLRYRHGPNYQHPAPIQDAQQALRTVRKRAEDWRVRPDQVGMLGFSAGGHLASTASTYFNRKPAPDESIDAAYSARPDFAVLIYPVITLDGPFAHQGSRRNLLGDNPSPDLVRRLSNDEQVTPETPPTFLVHTWADTAVPAENSLQYYAALRRAGVRAEMHLFEPGNHGFGLAPDNPVLSQWPVLCAAWLQGMALLEHPKKID